MLDNKPFNPTRVEDFISFEDYDNVPGFVISQAAYAISKTLTKRMKEAGVNLTPHEFAVLNRLTEFPTLNQRNIAQLTYKDRPAVTRMLERMISKGLVEKQLCDKDRRAFQVALTEKGRKVRETVVPIAREVMLQALSDADGKEIATTLKLLQKITANMDLQGG